MKSELSRPIWKKLKRNQEKRRRSRSSRTGKAKEKKRKRREGKGREGKEKEGKLLSLPRHVIASEESVDSKSVYKRHLTKKSKQEKKQFLSASYIWRDPLRFYIQTLLSKLHHSSAGAKKERKKEKKKKKEKERKVK